jgi:hypothetical protein
MVVYEIVCLFYRKIYRNLNSSRCIEQEVSSVREYNFTFSYNLISFFLTNNLNSVDITVALVVPSEERAVTCTFIV